MCKPVEVTESLAVCSACSKWDWDYCPWCDVRATLISATLQILGILYERSHFSSGYKLEVTLPTKRSLKPSSHHNSVQEKGLLCQKRPVVRARADGFCRTYWRKAILFQSQLISTQNETKTNQIRKHYSKQTHKKRTKNSFLWAGKQCRWYWTKEIILMTHIMY